MVLNIILYLFPTRTHRKSWILFFQDRDFLSLVIKHNINGISEVTGAKRLMELLQNLEILYFILIY